MAKRQPFHMEDNTDKIIAKIKEKPEKAMNIIGQNLVKEIKANTLKTMYSSRTKILSRTLGYWARKQEGDLQVGFKMSIERNAYGAGPGIVGDMVAKHKDPIKPIVAKNRYMFQDLITKALQEIEKDKV